MARSVNSRRPATLAALAAELGVPRTTVSNAYNRLDQLSPELRERVLETARRLGYPGPQLDRLQPRRRIVKLSTELVVRATSGSAGHTDRPWFFGL